MNNETQFKVQAYADGELSEREAQSLLQQLEGDAEGKALLGELQMTRMVLRGNELEIKLPETREFYWSKIQREIDRSTPASSRAAKWSWWKPIYGRVATGFAAGCALLMITFMAFNEPRRSSYAMDEVEGTTDEMGSITFHSDKDGMTVVYLFDREAVSVVNSK